MRLKLTLNRPANSAAAADVLITVDTTVTVGELAEAIGRRDPVSPIKIPDGGVTLAVQDGSAQRPLRHDATVADAGLRSGQTVAVVKRPNKPAAEEIGDASAVLAVVDGPDAGREFNLVLGASYIGRRKDNTVQLADPLVSNQHARITVGDTIEIVDLGSSNGVLIGGDPVARAIVGPNDEITLGDSVMRVVMRGGVGPNRSAPTVEFNRPPRLDIVYKGTEFEAPEVPTPPDKARFSISAIAAPILMAGLMYALTGNILSILFVAMSPVLMIGNTMEQRMLAKRALREATEAYHAALGSLQDELDQARTDEVTGRRAEHTSIVELAPAALHRGTLLWTMRPDRRGFLDVRLGTATLPSRNSVKMPSKARSLPDLWQELVDLRDQYTHVEAVPAVGSLRESGSLGIAGGRTAALGVARSVIGQLVLLHSPAEMVLLGAMSSTSARDWDWLKWVPHTSSDHTPIKTDNLASSPGSVLRLVSELEDLLARRAEDSKDDELPLPSIVLLIEDDAPIERSRLVSIAEQGPAQGIHVVWVATSVARLPAACGVFVELNASDPARGTIGYLSTGEPAVETALEPLDAAAVVEIARALSPVVDSGARVDDDSDLPRNVSLLSVTGKEPAQSGEHIVERWRESNSLPLPAGESPRRRKRDNHLRSTIGVAAGRNLVLDLREHGPHALVGGTTGSGKSEFLQSWVISIAAEHSPSRVTFLFVDYKGGAAFADCLELPHCVGLVTDLSMHLVRRALTSLKAELRYREQILQRKRAKDLLELEKRGDPEAPPSLVIVVDEFAALVQEVPEFVDGVVDVAQRGRSLGLHLVLATQNPGQSIKDNLRANTNLRVALRMADPEHSLDVIGTPQAALFDPGLPGRGIVKTGAGRLTPFQTGYVGGHTSDAPPPVIITVEELQLGDRSEWEAPPETIVEERDDGPTDLKRLVHSVRSAHSSAFTMTGPDGEKKVAYPRRPWLDELASAYDLAKSPQSRTDTELIFAILDDPENQRQVPVAFAPDRDGNMAIFGTGGSGKTTVLRTLAVVAGLTSRGGPCHVYGLDFGGRTLQILEPLDHVGAIVNGDDSERVQRLIGYLRDVIDERAVRYAAAKAGTIVDYRVQANKPDEPRILLLVDAVGTFRDEYEVGPSTRWYDAFLNIAAEGRQVGVHVIVTADRPAAVSSALSSTISRRLTLRMASETDYMTLGVPDDIFTPDSPPGRGVLDGKDVQVTVLGGTPNTAHQATAIEQLAKQLRSRAGGRAPAAPIGKLADRVALSDLPSDSNGLPTLGLSYDTLDPMGFALDDTFVVGGPPQSGRTSVMATIVQSLVRCGKTKLVYLGAGRSALATSAAWIREARGDVEIADLARELTESITAANKPDAIVIEDFTSLTSYDITDALEPLLAVCKREGVMVISDGDTSSMTASQLYRPLVNARHGLVLQPDQFDGENLFKTPLPRVVRAEFPPGRGFYIRGGKTWRLQCALPDLSST